MPQIVCGDGLAIQLGDDGLDTAAVIERISRMPPSSFPGTGIYRSTDASATWQSLGLTNSDRIGGIVIDPKLAY